MALRSSPAMLLVPSLKPILLRGVLLRGPPRVPDWCHFSVTGPVRFLRAVVVASAWSAQTWTARSPPERAGSSWSPKKGGSGLSEAGFLCARPYRSSKRPGPKPNVIVRRSCLWRLRRRVAGVDQARGGAGGAWGVAGGAAEGGETRGG